MALDRLARAARALRPSDVPPDVLRLARLQHLAGAAAARHGGGLGPGALSALGWDDPQLGGRVGLGVLPQAWARPRGTLDAWLVATVAGGELGARVGLAGLLGDRARAETWFPAVIGGATTAALLEDADVGAVVGGALGACRRAGLHPPAVDDAPASEGESIARLITRGLVDRGAANVLDEGEPFWAEACARPLVAALHGEAWLLRTLVVSPTPGRLHTQVPTQAVAEILARHVKAAEKRLRPDQVERVEVRVPFPAWAAEGMATAMQGPGGLAWSIARRVALQVVFPEGPGEAQAAGLTGSRADELAAVASTVDVVHDWALSQQMLRGLGATGLFAGFGPLDYRAVRARWKPAGAWPAWHPAEVPSFLQGDPVATVATVGGAPRLELDTFSWELPVRVRLYTTRGGWWPERRSRPRGTVPGGDLEQIALARFGAGAEALLAAPGDMPAAEWIAGLRG